MKLAINKAFILIKN